MYAAENGDIDGKIFIIYMLSFQFSAIKIFNVHFYDIFLVALVLLCIVYKNGKIIVQNGIELLTFLFLIIIRLVLKPTDLALTDTASYITCIITFIFILNLNKNSLYIKEKLPELSISSLYFTLIVFFLYSRGMIKNVTNGLITSDIFMYTDELRMNGFFTDPNKYLVYEMALICLLILYRESNFIILLTVIATVLSMSRSSLICIIVYILLILYRYLNNRFNSKSKAIFALLLIIFGCGIIYFISTTNFNNAVFKGMGRLLGRTRSVEYTATIMDDNRLKIWHLAIGLIKNKPFIGYGLGAISDKNILPFGTHNTFLGLMVKGGIFLLFAFILFFRKLFVHPNAEKIAFIILPLFFLDLDAYRVLYLMYAVYMEIPDGLELYSKN